MPTTHDLFLKAESTLLNRPMNDTTDLGAHHNQGIRPPLRVAGDTPETEQFTTEHVAVKSCN